MTFEEIKSLIQLINKSDLAEFRFEEGEQKLLIRTSKYNNGKQQIFQTCSPNVCTGFNCCIHANIHPHASTYAKG